MQGLQWPYMPQYRRRDLGLRLGRRQLPTDSQRQPEHLADVHRAARSGAVPVAGHADLHERRLVRAGAGRDRRQHDQYNVQPAPGVVAADDVWVRTGALQQLGRHGRPVPGLRRLSAGDGPRSQHLRAPGRLRSRVHGQPQRVRRRCPALRARTTCSTGPPRPKVGDVALHLYPIPVPAHRAARAVRQRRHRELSRRPARRHLRHRLVQAAGGRSSTSTSSPRIPARRPRTPSRTAAARARSRSCSPPSSRPA